MKQFGLDVQVSGMDPMAFMAKLLHENELQQIEIERGKLAVAILKQMNNRSRLLLDTEKFRAKMAAEVPEGTTDLRRAV